MKVQMKDKEGTAAREGRASSIFWLKAGFPSPPPTLRVPWCLLAFRDDPAAPSSPGMHQALQQPRRNSSASTFLTICPTFPFVARW